MSDDMEHDFDNATRGAVLHADAWLCDGPHGRSVHLTRFKVRPEAGCVWTPLVIATSVDGEPRYRLTDAGRAHLEGKK